MNHICLQKNWAKAASADCILFSPEHRACVLTKARTLAIVRVRKTQVGTVAVLLREQELSPLGLFC